MHVRQLSAPDVPRYKALMLHAYEVAADAFTSTPQERAAEPDAWWISRIDHSEGMSQVFGAYDGDDMVGAVTIEFSEKFKTRHKAHLLGMFVKASARGQGIGKALLTSALSAAKDRPGVLVVMLTVTEGNHSASALYESCGFKAFGIEPMAVATTDGYHAKVHMWHRLP